MASSSGTNLDSKSMPSRGIRQLMINSINSSVSESKSVKLAFKMCCQCCYSQSHVIYIWVRHIDYWGMRYICHTVGDEILTANISWRFFVSPKDNLRKYRRNSQQIFKNRVSFISIKQWIQETPTKEILTLSFVFIMPFCWWNIWEQLFNKPFSDVAYVTIITTNPPYWLGKWIP